MTERAFNPSMSTNEIWRGDDTTRCLTDDLDGIDASIAAINTNFSPVNHTHDYSDIEPIAIENGSDLNSITTEGVYYRSSVGTSTSTIENIPSDIGTATFILEVFKGGNTGQIIQRITRCDKNNTIIYQRVYYSGSWGNWKSMFDNDDGQKVLWNGWYYMSNTQVINLTESIQDQSNGIVLVFSLYDTTVQEPVNGAFSTFFIPKKLIELQDGYGMCFRLTSFDGGIQGHKYIYVGNTRLAGHANNNQNVTKGGISYTNTNFVLRYVIGV